MPLLTMVARITSVVLYESAGAMQITRLVLSKAYSAF
jgi:hypothetical protein